MEAGLHRQPNAYQTLRARSSKRTDESFTFGIWLKDDGTIDDIDPGAPAWEAGLGPGMKIVAVDGRAWTPDVLAEQIQAAKGEQRADRDRGRSRGTCSGRSR